MRTRTLVLIAAILGASLLASAGQQVAPAEAAGPGTWTPAASMPYARYWHTQTLLRDGRVLVTGGSGQQTHFAETAIYNRPTNTWTTTAPMHDARTLHTATLLRDGRVLVAGGWTSDDDDPATAEIYNPATNTWTLISSMHDARWRHTATLLPDGRVLVTGGEVPPPSLDGLRSAETYDPSSGVWVQAPDMANARLDHSAILLPDGRVFVVGAGSELYDPGLNSWTPASDPPGGSRQAALLPDGRVLSVNETTSNIYDPATNLWEAVDPPLVAHALDFTLTLLGNGQALRGGSPGLLYSASTETFDPASMTWKVQGPMSTSRQSHAAVLLHTGEVLFTGGQSEDSGHLATAELYDATAWVPVAPMSAVNRSAGSALLHSGDALITGKIPAEVFHPAVGNWTTTSPPAVDPDTHAAVTLLNGRVLVVDGVSSSTEIYDPGTNTWITASPLPSSGFAGDTRLKSGSVLTVVLEFGGTSVHIYNPSLNSWSTAPAFTTPSFPSFVQLKDGRVLMSGGYLNCSTSCTSTTEASIFDPATNSESSISPMVDSRVGHSLTTMNDGRVLAAGGAGPSEFTQRTSTEIYDPTTNTWTAGPSLATTHAGHGATLLDSGSVLISGGRQSPGNTGSELLAPPFNAWTDAGTLPEPRDGGVSTLLPDGRVLRAGGTGAGSVSLASAVVYDLGIHTDTDGDGYNDGLELALGQHPWSNCKTMRGDLTGDGIVNSGDQGKLASKFGVRPPPSRFDQNGDKQINSGDQGLMASKFNQRVLMCP